MTTLASAVWRDYMNAICDLPDYPSAVFSGIVGDKNHTRGYHLSIEDNKSTDFSVTHVDDKAPPGNWPRNLASAGDRSMNKADMVKAWGRWFAVWQNRANDPRAKFFRAYNGWDGSGSAQRLDFVKGTITDASSDHTWHDHEEGRRRYANDPELKRAGLSINRGETIAQYLGMSGGNVMSGEADKAFATRYTGVEGWISGESWMAKAVEKPIVEMNRKLDTLLGRPVITDEQIDKLAVQLAKETNKDVIKDALKSVLREGVE